MAQARESMLEWDVFVAAAKPIVSDDLPPGELRRTWSPTTATLIYGQRDAVLIDPLMTIQEARALSGWIASKGKNLTTIFVSHGRGDHHFALGLLLECFPGARALATPRVVARMQQELSPSTLEEFWQPRFPGQLPERMAVAEPLSGLTFELEGRALYALELGHSEPHGTSCVHVPELDLVVAGDAIYNDVHLQLSDSSPDGRRAWLESLEQIEALRPRTVIAGHKRPGKADSPRTIADTRRYLRDFERAAAKAKEARALYDDVLALHPNRVNRGALWSSARSLLPGTTSRSTRFADQLSARNRFDERFGLQLTV